MYEPDEQLEQLDEPDADEKVPGEQLVQDEAALVMAALPAVQPTPIP